MEQICPRCGARTGTASCPVCGYPMPHAVPSDATVVHSASPGTGMYDAPTQLRPQAPPAAPSPLARDRSALGLTIGIGAAVVVLAGAVAGIGIVLGRGPGTSGPMTVTTVTASATGVTTVVAGPSPVRPATSTPATVTTVPVPSATPSVMTEAQARALLDAEAKSYAVTTDNHYLVELSAKWVGAVDPQLTAANGGHTFYAVDILAEYRDLRARFGSSVRMVYSTSFGKQTVNSKIPPGELLYVVVYDPRTFSGKDAAQAWCRSAYPGLSGDPLDNVCQPRPASPPF